MGAALTFVAVEDKIWIARALLQNLPALLPLAKERQGSAALIQMLETLHGHESAHACDIIVEHRDMLMSSRWGRAVAEHASSMGNPGA